MSNQDTNKDGLIPGQIVDNETCSRIENQRRMAKPEPAAPVKPRRKKTEPDDSQ